MPISIFAVLSVLASAFIAASGIVPPLTRFITYLFNRVVPNALPEVESLISMRMRGLITESDFLDMMRAHGYDETQARRLLATYVALLDVGTLIEARRRGIIDRTEFLARIRRFGYSDRDAEIIYDASRRLLDADGLVTLHFRGILSREEFLKEMEARGFDRKEAERILRAAEVFPSPGDVVRFAAMELFSPEVVQRFQMLAELSQEYLDMAKKTGMSEEVAKLYWAAHWTLPPVELGFRMYQRGIITAEELDMLLRTQNITPFWREKLRQFYFRVLPRGDIRRLYWAGIIDRDQVYRKFLDLGYKPEDAEALTKWVEVRALEMERTLTKRQILELFELGEIEEETAKRLLEEIGYSKDAAEYLIVLQKHEMANRENQEVISALVDMYLMGTIDEDKLFDELSKLGLRGTTIQKIMLRATRQKMRQTRMPSLHDHIRWLKAGLISRAEFRRRLAMMGYRPEDIRLYEIEAVGPEPLVPAPKEAAPGLPRAPPPSERPEREYT